MKNIEIKARCPDPDRAREAARHLGASFQGHLLQTDTFYHARSGRVKLRQFGDGTAELILYQRAFGSAPRPSEYVVLPVAEPAGAGALLEAAFGVQVVVRKKRELWLLDNVRIHLDSVEGLGSFLELEAVVDGAHPEDACHAAVRRLLGELAIGQEDLCSRAYADELAERGGGPRPDEILVSGRFLDFVVRDGWEFAARKGITGIVGIVAVTGDDRVLLTEQYRPPMRCRVCELPAGLVGDEPTSPEEDLIEGAARELCEETGYAALHWRLLAHGPTSPGTTSEMMTLLLATGLARVGPGGGGAGEEIEVHEVPIGSAESWLAEREAAGVMVDLKVHAGLCFLKRGSR
jgi:ADP-ribose pyrophosphatase